MNRFLVLTSAFAGAFSFPIHAQGSAEQCGPPRTVAPSTCPELDSVNLNVQEVGQIFVIPNPAGTPAWLGSFTGVQPAATDYDFGMFTWNGPGSNPTLEPLSRTAALNGTGDEFQMSLHPNGLVCVGDGGANQGSPFISTRTGLAADFPAGSPLRDGSQVGNPPFAGYIDPQIAIRNGRAVLMYAASNNAIMVGDLEINSASPNYGVVSNQRIGVAAVTGDANFRFWHSPTPVVDATGEARAIICSKYDITSGSDGYYQSTIEAGAYPTAAGIKPYLLHNDGGDWNANPLNIHGTACYADAAGAAYGVPLRIDYFGCSSSRFPAAAGGTVNHTVHTPLGGPAQMIVAFNYGLPFGPIDIGPLNLGLGWLCVSPLAPVGPLPVVNNEASLSFAVGAGVASPGAQLDVQAVAVDLSNGRAWVSNRAVLVAQ